MKKIFLLAAIALVTATVGDVAKAAPPLGSALCKQVAGCPGVRGPAGPRGPAGAQGPVGTGLRILHPSIVWLRDSQITLGNPRIFSQPFNLPRTTGALFFTVDGYYFNQSPPVAGMCLLTARLLLANDTSISLGSHDFQIRQPEDQGLFSFLFPMDPLNNASGTTQAILSFELSSNHTSCLSNESTLHIDLGQPLPTFFY
ncbi:MAG: hypothetical protein Q7T03_05105 [Deltaproteobacteria bacterium]|nr:hypothetical protein [Deltaproteobacteria bacterium]